MANSTIKASLTVIGGGGAGLAAAMTAMENGLDGTIVVLEKSPYTGGNSRMAGGHLFATETRFQKETGQFISCDEVFHETMQFHHYDRVEPKILRRFINMSASTVEWVESHGFPYFGDGITNFMVHGKYPFGNFIKVTRRLTEKLSEAGHTILTNVEAVDIVRDAFGQVCAVKAVDADSQPLTVETGAVVLSTGGFVGNQELLHKYFPGQYSDIYYTDALPLDGSGVGIAERVGAQMKDYCTIIKENAYSCNSRTDSPNRAGHNPTTLWVNALGARFHDETNTRNETTNALVRQPGMVGFALFDEDIMERACTTPVMHMPEHELVDIRRQFKEERKRGEEWICIADSLEEIARWIGARPDALQKTVDGYNADCDAGRDSLFAKNPDCLMPLRKAPFYAIKFRPILIDTIGPVTVNEDMQIMDEENNPIPGLYAAGVLTSGWQGHDYHLRGSALCYSLTSGRIAGKSAVEYISE